MLRTKKKQLNLKPNRVLDKRSSRGMLYENEELRLRTIHINDEVDRGHTDIKKLRKENEYLKREIWSLRDECSKLEDVLKKVYSGNPPPLSELPQYQPRVRKQSTFSGIWGSRRGSNMSFSNCSSYDYDIDIDTENHDNENDPDYDGGDDNSGYDTQGYSHHKKVSRQTSNTNSLQDGGSVQNFPASSNANTTHVNWEDQQKVEVYLEPGSGGDTGSGHGQGMEDMDSENLDLENLPNQKVPHSHHNHNWQMHSPDLEAVTEESENASNSNNSNNNSNPTSQVLPIPTPGEIFISNPNSNASSINNLHSALYMDNDSALFEALEFESMNCSMERIHMHNDDQNQRLLANKLRNHLQDPPCSSSTSNLHNGSALNVDIERALSSNSFFRPTIEITPALSSPTSTITNGNDGRRTSASFSHLPDFNEGGRELRNSTTGTYASGPTNQQQLYQQQHSYPGDSSSISISDSYHDLGCVTEIPKKYQVTSELKIAASRTNSLDHIPGVPDAPILDSNSQSADRRSEQVSGSGSGPTLLPLGVRNHHHNLSTLNKPGSASVGGDDSVGLSQTLQNQNINPSTVVGGTCSNTNNNNNRELAHSTSCSEANALANANTNNNKPVPASYRVLKIYSSYLSKTQRRHSTSKNNSTSLSQSEPNLNSQDIFQFQFHPSHRLHEHDPDYDGTDAGWSPRNGQLTCRKLQGWSRSCCHTSTICQCHSNSRTNLNPFEMCNCNCAGENPHINLKDDWNVFDRNIVIGMIDDDSVEGSSRDSCNHVSLRYLSVQEVIDELESQFDSTLENAQGVRLLTLPDFYPCRVFISVRTAVSVKTLIEKGLTLRGQRMKLIDASQNAFSFIILSGLPSSFPDSSIISVLNEFGQVVAPLQRRVYKGVDTTERIARMHLVRIPPTSQIPLNIAGYEVLAKFVSQPSHEIPVSSVLSTSNDMISTHAVLTSTSTSPSTGTSATNPSTNTNTNTPNTNLVNSQQKNANLSLLTTTTAATSDHFNGQTAIGMGGNKSPVPGTASPIISALPRPHRLVTRSATLDSALVGNASGTSQPSTPLLQLHPNPNNVQTPTSNSRFALGPTAAAISKRNMSICGSLLEGNSATENVNFPGGQKNMLLGNPKKPLSRLPRSSPGSLVPPSPGGGNGPSGQLGDSGLAVGGTNMRPLSRSMSFEPRRTSGNGKALNAGSQLSLVESHKLNPSSSGFPLNDSLGSGNALSRQQSRIFQQHRKLSQASSAHFQASLDKKEELPWCGCWGNGCI